MGILGVYNTPMFNAATKEKTMTVRGDILSEDTIRIRQTALDDAGIMAFPFAAIDRETEREVECYANHKVVRGGYTHFTFRDPEPADEQESVAAIRCFERNDDDAYFGNPGQVADGLVDIAGVPHVVRAFRNRRIEIMNDMDGGLVQRAPHIRKEMRRLMGWA